MQKIIPDMLKKHLPILIALVPAFAAVGLIAKMNQSQESALADKNQEITSLINEVKLNEQKILELNQLCNGAENCISLISNRLAQVEGRTQNLTTQLEDKENSLSVMSREKETMVSHLQSELSKANERLRVAKQTVDAQISIELEGVEEQIAVMKSGYEEVISGLRNDLDQVRLSSQEEVEKKEEKFKELHKKSINNLLGMVDSLAQERESRIIPLISSLDDATFKQRFVCSDASLLNPSEMIFAKHMNRHWMTWPITVTDNSQNSVQGKTMSGFDVVLHWENTNNMYDLSAGDNVIIQFQPEADQSCHGAIQGKRAVFTTH